MNMNKKFGNRDCLLASISALVDSAEFLKAYVDSCPVGYKRDFIVLRETIARFGDQLQTLPDLAEFAGMLKPLPSVRLGLNK